MMRTLTRTFAAAAAVTLIAACNGRDDRVFDDTAPATAPAPAPEMAPPPPIMQPAPYDTIGHDTLMGPGTPGTGAPGTGAPGTGTGTVPPTGTTGGYR
jgi:hypothetical protein